jgi:dTDP-4-dehydrorhamnose reductase
VWLILGGEGQLGRCLQNTLLARDVQFVAVGRNEVDITHKEKVTSFVKQISPSVIVNTAAWTAVDAAEDNEEAAHAVNALGAAHVAYAAHLTDSQLVHVSTDYVFSGTAQSPISEDAPCTPVSAYGRSKLAGEEAVQTHHAHGSLIVRTAWLYSSLGSNFALTMARRALTNQPVRVVNDQFGQPTFAHDLAEHIAQLVHHKAPVGVYHGTNAGQATWYEFAREIYDLLEGDLNLVTPVSGTEYPARARRPSYSVLDHRRTHAAGLSEMRDWKIALVDAMPAIVQNLKMEENL